jgi:hypothetical protein
MMTAGEVSVFLGPLQTLLKYLQKDRHHRSEAKDAALLALDEALLATKKYLELTREDRTEEYRLASLWGAAAVKARHASTELAVRLQDKSVYWSDRFKWSREEVIRRRIDFDALERDFRRLLTR